MPTALRWISDLALTAAAGFVAFDIEYNPWIAPSGSGLLRGRQPRGRIPEFRWIAHEKRDNRRRCLSQRPAMKPHPFGR